MHLLVLSAFRLDRVTIPQPILPSLNAPSGAQCFPTADARASHTSVAGLNAPSGAQCFPTRIPVLPSWRGWRLNAPSGAQCFPTIALPDTHVMGLLSSQCTFWCSVLSDSAPRKPRHNAVYRNEIAADLESTTSNRPAHVQLNHTTAKNRHKPPQRRRRPLPASTPPTFNQPKPKNRPLTTTPE